ncbi:hypothetical protein [Streptomyces sp. NPDC017993]|uniref:hypothetical protein n=1 Tax=Streptomyces sp. NPDC017993 TaxID=3365027 RepID=UPI0037B3B940
MDQLPQPGQAEPLALLRASIRADSFFTPTASTDTSAVDGNSSASCVTNRAAGRQPLLVGDCGCAEERVVGCGCGIALRAAVSEVARSLAARAALLAAARRSEMILVLVISMTTHEHTIRHGPWADRAMGARRRAAQLCCPGRSVPPRSEVGY